jgi:hypothetical protein
MSIDARKPSTKESSPEIARDGNESVAGFKLPLSECWMPVGPGTMPIPAVTVVAWDMNGELRPAYLDPEDGYLYGQADGVGFREGFITHWRYCNGPDVIDIMSIANDPGAATVPEPDIILSAPYSQVHVSASAAGEHIDMRARQLAAILGVMPLAAYSVPMVQLASRLAGDLVTEIEAGGGALLAAQLAELLLMIQNEDGPCHLLWLSQQIADEIDEAISGMIKEGGPA